ncbi:MAG: hypothetical protein J6336_03985 [Kiritimatiellae bacterium]|nr:hypothetical protein [Kiritimatiellia bacterium]
MKKKPTQFDFWYAVNNTKIVQPPRRHLETFGNTIINYRLISELMDGVGKVRIREGRMQALKPQIILPSSYASLALEGFGEEAHKYMEWLKEHEDTVRILRYGYTLKQEAFSEQVVSDSVDAVLARVQSDNAVKEDPFSAVVQGVDDPWDVCLVRLFWTVIRNSASANIREMNERHLFEMQDGVPQAVRDEIEKAFESATRDPALIKPLGKLLQDHGVFELYQDRFFNLVQGRG